MFAALRQYAESSKVFIFKWAKGDGPVLGVHVAAQRT